MRGRSAGQRDSPGRSLGAAAWAPSPRRALFWGIFPAFRQNLRDGVISGSGSSVSASEAAHSSPWALLWAQPRLLYNLGFPEKLKREMKDSYQSCPRSLQIPERGVLSLFLPSSSTLQRGNLPRWGWRT